MAKQLKLLFFGLLAVSFTIFGYLNIWHYVSNRSVDTQVTDVSTDAQSLQFSQNHEANSVIQNSYDLVVKQTQKRTLKLIMARLRSINDSSWYRYHPVKHTLSSFGTVSSLKLSVNLTDSVMPTPYVSQFHHASDTVQHWSRDSVAQMTLADLPTVNVTGVDCNKLFHGDKNALREVRKFQNTSVKKVIPAARFIQQASNCMRFIAERKYAVNPVNSEEAVFPIAFSVLMFKDVEQFERLLRAIYRPQNLYCIHVDNKSHPDVHAAVTMIARCFENVFILQQSFDVHWGTFSVLEPELACMKRLLQHSKKWKYFINLTGQEFPLKTNWQIVRILKAFNGSNNMEGTLKRFVVLNFIIVDCESKHHDKIIFDVLHVRCFNCDYTWKLFMHKPQLERIYGTYIMYYVQYPYVILPCLHTYAVENNVA